MTLFLSISATASTLFCVISWLLIFIFEVDMQRCIPKAWHKYYNPLANAWLVLWLVAFAYAFFSIGMLTGLPVNP